MESGLRAGFAPAAPDSASVFFGLKVSFMIKA
jgi:hypothetical protein